jgi:hypothetical protein
VARQVVFVIEDETHAEPQGEFDTRDAAIAELRRRETIPWDVAPNVAPCMSWRTCGRRYEIVEYDTSTEPWREVNRTHALDVSASGAAWSAGLGDGRSRLPDPERH